MKNFDYYSTPNADYFGFDERREYESKLIEEINKAKMTAEDRQIAKKQAKTRAVDWQREQNEPYYAEINLRQAEFWADAREELGYTRWLSEKGVEALEAKAWEDGHSAGFSEVFMCLDRLVDFARAIVESCKPSVNMRSA